MYSEVLYRAFLRSDVFKADDLGKEITFIALPAVLALAADPLASLVDTAFIGRIGTDVMQVIQSVSKTVRFLNLVV